jgi:hypothetical protein
LASMRQMVVRAALVLGYGLSGSLALAAPPDSSTLSIHYSLLTSFAGAETAYGRIVVNVVNHTDYTLADVTLRLPDPAGGRLTGPLQEEFDLASGESRRLEGDFVLPAAALAPGQALQWLVVYSDAGGFAQQQYVRGQTDENARGPVPTKPVSTAAKMQRVN